MCTEKAVDLAKPGGEGREHWRQVCFLAGERDVAVRLVKCHFGRREELRADKRIIYIPQGSGTIKELRRVGTERDYSLILFERFSANS